MIGLMMCLKELVLTKPKVCRSALFAMAGNIKINFRFQLNECNGSHNLTQKTLSFFYFLFILFIYHLFGYPLFATVIHPKKKYLKT